MTNVAGRVLWIVLLLVAPGEIDGRQPPSRTAPGAPLKGGASGEQIYQAACLTCHAAGGAGSPQSVVGFDTPLPDFTDCAFATGEPDPDWYAVVHEGGPVRALGKHMPAFGEALSPDEIGLALGHIRTFCSEPAWPRGDLNLPRAFFTEKAYPENEAVWATTVTSGEVGAIENQLIYERRFGARNQLEVVAPIGFAKDAAGQWQRGLGDVALAFKRTLHASMRTGSIGSAGVEVILPTGKEQAGLGNGYTLFEPFAMWGQILPADFYLQFHGGLELPTDSSRGAKEGYVRSAFGTTFAEDRGFGRAWSPQVELLWARAEGGASDWAVVPQVQVTLFKLQHVMVAGGVRVPLTRRGGAADRRTQAVVYLLWD